MLSHINYVKRQICQYFQHKNIPLKHMMKNKILLYDNMHARFIQQKIKQQTYYETALQYTTTSCAPILVLQSLVIPSTN